MTAPLPNGGWIAEEALAVRLNVRRSVLRPLRPGLNTGNAELRGNVVYWKKTAAVTAAVTLGLSLEFEPPEKSGVAPGAGAGLPQPSPEELGEVAEVVSLPLVNGRHFSNPHLIKAKRQKNGEVVIVRVVDSGKYRPVGRNGKPMELRIVPGQEGTWWRPAGREPRFVGAY